MIEPEKSSLLNFNLKDFLGVFGHLLPDSWFSDDTQPQEYYLRYRKICNPTSYQKFRWKRLLLPLIMLSIVWTVGFSGIIPPVHPNVLGRRAHQDQVGGFHLANMFGFAVVFILFLFPISLSYRDFIYVIWGCFAYFSLYITLQLLISKGLIQLIPTHKTVKIKIYPEH